MFISSWKCSNLQNNFGFNLISKNYLPKKCGYKDMNNQMELIECDKTVLNSYICQKTNKTANDYERGFLILIKFISVKIFLII